MQSVQVLYMTVSELYTCTYTIEVQMHVMRISSHYCNYKCVYIYIQVRAPLIVLVAS